ncbi:hypothetical protein VTO42DRAFT_3890 [Malbranchea cinnamomea]
MASHVVVLDSTARRAQVKVTPSKHLSEVLGEACSKLGLDPTQYGMKYQKKLLDLSLSVRLSGLTSGAKLELVQLSRSPSLVSVALQLPESEVRGAPNARLMDKFPSNTTIWLVLRKFEAGVAGDGATRNLTGRGVPVTSGDSGAGRLFYQQPVVQLMGRELSSFTDLQKTLAQLGYNSGSILLRLSFRTTDRPIEEAMNEIEAYFQSVDEDKKLTEENKTPSNVETPVLSKPTEPTLESTPAETEQPSPPEPMTTTEQPPTTSTTTSITAASESQPLASSRPVTVYAPPSGSTPQSALFAYNEEDYVPTVDQAKAHQRYLEAAGRPGRLASDAELAAQESARQEKLARITEIDVKVRFPDQSQVVAKFGRNDTANDLYRFVRSCLDEGLATEAFSLSHFAGRAQAAIPDSSDKYLIKDLKMSGRVLVNFVWEGNAALAARSAGREILRPELRRAAAQIKVEDVGAMAVEDEKEPEQDRKARMRRMGGGDNSSGGTGAGTGERKIPKWLKLPGKK